MKSAVTIFLLVGVALFATSCGEKSQAQIFGERIVIYKSTGTKQCESKGTHVKESEKALLSAGVAVQKSECGFLTGLTILATCGVEDLSINVHTILSTNIIDALRLGYEPVSELEESPAVGYTSYDC